MSVMASKIELLEAQIAKAALPIESLRLVIRPIELSDAYENYQAMCKSREDLQRWMSWAHPWPTEFETADWTVKEVGFFKKKKPQGRYSAHLKTNTKLAVSLGITVLRQDIRRFHISYWACKEFTGQGYTTEALIALSRWLFTNFGANRIDSGCAVGNIASKRVLEKAGYTFEGVQKNATHLPPDMVTDELIFAATDIGQLASLTASPPSSHA